MSSDRSSLPIAMFDSGVGGLTVLHECLVSLPEEDFLYLGDSARFPYGTKTAAQLRGYVDENTRLLLERGAKVVVIACNSATAAGEEVARRVAVERGVEVVGVVEPAAEIAAAITERARVGVLATPATVASGAYRDALERQGRELDVIEVAAADLAPIIQNGFPFDEQVVATVRSYCAPLKDAGVDTVILGSTHYPLVAPMLQRVLGRDVRLVTAGHAVAASVQRRLEARGLATTNDGEGTYRFLCTGDVDAFMEVGTRFLQMPLGEVERVKLGGHGRGHYALTMSILEQVQADTRQAMKARERERVGALRMIASALQDDAKLGKDDEVAVLQRERKKRLEAAEAFRKGGSEERAGTEESEARLIERYLPQQLSDEELADVVSAAIEEAGASEPADMGKVMSVVMPRVSGRADGRRVSEAVKDRLSA
jgi:glutamate racemase